MPHLVTGANADWGDRDIQLNAGKSIAYTFAEPGVYPYACTLHPGMSGAIVVGDGGPSLAAAFAAAGGAGDGSGSGGTSAAVTPTAAPVAQGPDPLVLAAVAALVGAALALAVILVAVRMRNRKPALDGAAATTAEPVTR